MLRSLPNTAEELNSIIEAKTKLVDAIYYDPVAIFQFDERWRQLNLEKRKLPSHTFSAGREDENFSWVMSDEHAYQKAKGMPSSRIDQDRDERERNKLREAMTSELREALATERYDEPLKDGSSPLRRAIDVHQFEAAKNMIDQGLVKSPLLSEPDRMWAASTVNALLAFILTSTTHPRVAACLIDAGVPAVGKMARRNLSGGCGIASAGTDELVTGLQCMCEVTPNGQPELIKCVTQDHHGSQPRDKIAPRLQVRPPSTKIVLTIATQAHAKSLTQDRAKRTDTLE